MNECLKLLDLYFYAYISFFFQHVIYAWLAPETCPYSPENAEQQ